MKLRTYVCGVLVAAVGLVPQSGGQAVEPPPLDRAELAREAIEAIARGEDAKPLLDAVESLPAPYRRRADATPLVASALKQATDSASPAVEDHFIEVEARLRGLDLEQPAKALERLNRARAAYRAAAAEGEQALKSGPVISTADPIVLRSSLLPYRGLGLGPRSPVRESVVSPVYQDPTDPAEEPADRATSPTAPLSPAILAQAEALGYDYVKIFELVRNEIELEWTAGSLRGAEGTLAARRGNAVDQASLLVALLRGSGAAARFVHGVVELDLDQLQGDLGLSGAGHVLDFFARSGIAHEPVLRGGAIDAVQLEHTWVAARVPYTNYRGAVVDRSGWTWLPLDPALTQFTTEPATGVLEDVGFDAEAFRTSYLAEDRAETPLEQLRTDVEAYLVTTDPAATWADQLATKAPVAEALGLLPTSQSYRVVAITGERAVLDEERRAAATFVIRSATDPASAVVLDESLPLQDVAGRRVTLSYLPATVDDHRLVLAFGGFSRVPAYLVDVRPQIKVGGVTLSVGDAVPLGRAHRLAVRLDGAWGREEVTQTVIAGSYVAVAFGAPTAVVPLDDGDDAADTEGLAARLLSRTAYGYATAWDASENELARLFGLTLARPMPSVTLAINAAQVTEVDGLPFALSWQGVQLDAALRITDPVGEDAEPWRRLSALEGSALERRVLEELLRVDSISTVRGLARARALGIEIVEVTAATVGAVLPTLEHPEAVLRLIQEQAQAGQRLEVPRTQVAFRDWIGSLWTARDSAGGEGYFLAGGLRGGATAIDPADWPIPELAAAFGDPFQGEPNRDPLAGAVIEPIESLNQQFGTVAKSFAEPIGVSVRDAIGRPVVGARVTFRLLNGVGELIGEDDEDENDRLVQVVVTDAAGEALVTLEAGRMTADDPILIRREPTNTHRFQALRHVIGATVDTVDGELPMLRPIEAFAFPGPPQRIDRVDGPGGTELGGTIGLYSDSLSIAASDEHGNPVANVDLTAIVLPPDFDRLQEIDTGSGPLVSCLLPADLDTFFNLSVFESALDESGRFVDCEQPTPTANGGCGRELLTLETDWHGETYVGVVLGNAMVGYGLGLRRSFEWDQQCELALETAPEGYTLEETCGTLYEPPVPDPDDPVDPFLSELRYLYTPRVNIQTGTFGINPCTPSGATLGRLEGIGTAAAAPPAAPLPGQPTYVMGSLVENCRNLQVPVCHNPQICGDECANFPNAEDCGPCPCDPCEETPENCPQCIEGWDLCTALGGDDYPNFECLRFTVPLDPFAPRSCEFLGRECVATWAWTPSPVDLADPRTSFEVDAGGAVGPPGLAEPHRIQLSLATGGVAGEHRLSGQIRHHLPFFVTKPSGEVILSDTRATPQFSGLVHEDPLIGRFHSVDTSMTVQPEVLRLSDDGLTLDDIVVSYRVEPADYQSQGVQLELLENTDAVVARVIGSAAGGEGVAVIRRGVRLDPAAVHDLQLVVNPGGLYEIRSEPMPQAIDRQIIRSYSPFVRVEAETDLVNKTSCDSGGSFTFQLNEDATVRLEARLVTGYNVGDGTKQLGPPRVLFTGTYEARGVNAGGDDIVLEHREAVFVDDLSPGDWELALIATTSQGESERREARAQSELRVTDQLPLGHTIVKGVDLWNGTLTVGRQDLMFTSRGPDLTFSRTYSSAGAQVPGPLGLGWRHNWLSSLRTTSCGEVVIEGGEGSGMRFRFDGSPTSGQVELAPQNGYRASLVADLDAGVFDFYTLAGIRYRYAPSGESGRWMLDFIDDPNGNRLDLAYAPSVEGPILTTVTDASRRQIQLVYEARGFVGWKGQVVTSVTGPGGFGLSLSYDEFGHLVRATRADGLQDEAYAYEEEPGWDFPLRRALASVTDMLSGSVTSYGYEVGQQLTGESGGTRTVLHLVELTEPASPVPTRFDYDELSLSTGGGSPRTVVTDRRGETTTYDFNRFGGVERMEDPLGHVSLTEWIPGDVLIARSRNARGIWTEYEYDAHGNVLSETVGPPGDRFVSTMTYAGPGDFERPYIKNRMETKVDRDGDLTTLTYDSRGNLLSETTDLGRDPQGQNLGSLTVSHTYDELGDRRTMTDGRGFTTEYRFDDYGYPRLIIDPLGHTTQLEHDIRGRTIRTVDGEQNETLLAYDGLDRLTFQQFATGDFEATDYDDAGLRRLRTDASGRVTVTTFDREGRIARLDNAAGGSRVFGYSAEGDKILESLWFDAATPRHDIEYRYDAAGRLERRIEPLGRVTVYEHDAVGNVVSETLLDTNDPDFEPRVMTWPNYDALNRPLAEEKRLVDPLTGLERTLTTTFTWSGEGQKVAETDPLGRTTRWVYDGLDRLLQLAEGETTQHAALRVTRKIYDGNGNLVEETLENPLGAGDQTRRFVYDAAGRLTSEVDAEGHAAFYKYDRASNVIREIDRRGTVVEHDYDVRNRRVLTRLRLSRGRDEAVWAETSYSYDPVSNPVRERQANGNVVVTTFDGLDRVTEIRDSVGAVASLRYDARSNRISQTDGEGHESRVYFDALDRPIRMELPEDRVVERSFDVAGNTLTEKNPRGFASTYRYDTLERLRQVIDPPVAPATDGYRLTATYDDVGNVVAVMNRRGFTTDLTYDALNRPVRRLAPEINGERYEMTTSWDAADNMLSSIDPRGISTELTYDLENRRRTTTRAELLLETLEYDAAGSVRFVTDARGHTTGFEYDERGQVLTLNQPEAATTRHTYDLVGNRVRTVDPELRQLQWTHDLRNRMASERIEVEADRFATTFYEHDLRNLRTAVVRPKGEAHRQEWRYDGAGRLASVQMPDGGVTVYRYDPGGNLIEQTDAEACITRFAYDALDRRSQLTYPDGAVKRWTFDESSNTATRTDPSGRTTHFAYDALDREISRDLPLRADAALADQLDRIDWAWDRNNNLLQVDEAYTASGLHSTTRTYDAFDRPETVTDRFGREIVYQYDAVGNRTGLTAPNQSTQYTYDALNRLEAVTNGAGVTTYEYHRNSTLDRVAYPNGTTASYSYDTANRLEQITHFQGSAEISRYAYRYDDHSNRVRQEEFQLGHGTEVTTYDFDLNDRLELVVYPEKTVTYGYDQVGNRVTETIQPAAGGSPETKSYAYDVRHRLETITHALEPNEDVTYGYDPNGNQVQKTKNGLTVDYVFDALDRLTRIEEEGLPQGIYTFDYQGLRVQKQAKGRQVQYLYDDQSVLQRHDSVDGQISYDYGPDRLLSVDHPSAGRSFYLFDAMGSVVGLTTPSGSVSAQYSYDAFGSYRRQTETEGNVFGYTGHETDGESGLIYARARFYDPDVGLFLSEDPAQDDYLNPPSLHKYAYAFQNPTVYTDPTGEVEFFRKNVVGFFKRGGVDNAAEAAVGIEEEYGKAAGLVSAGVLGVLGAGAEMMAGIGEVANVAINVAVVTVAPTSSLGQQAADELDAAILATEQAARGLYQAATWAIENPSEAGAIAVEAAKELGGNLAGGDVRTVTKTVAFVAEMAAGGRGGLSGVRKLKDAAEAGAKRSTQRAVRTSSRMPEKPKPQSRGQAQPAQYCFAAGTPVAAAEGLVPIETVEEGDLVWARNDKTGEVQLRRVAQTFVTPGKRIWEVEIESADGEIETISTTAEHPFYVVGLKWVPAARLEPGDPLIGLNGETGLTVRQVRGSPRYETVYNFEVEVDHTYFVGESLVWVHNLCSEGRVRLSLLKRRQRQRQKGIHVPFDNEGFQTHLIKSRAALTRKFRPATHHQSNFINGRLTIMKKNDRFVQLLNSTLGSTGKPMNPSRAGFLDVVAHGSPEEIAFDIHRQAPKVNHRVLASYLRSKDEFRGQKIRLISCSTGQGCDSFAQRLADKLKVEVQGPSELVWASGEMPMFVAGQKGGRPAGFGEWKFFKPRNEYSRQD